jgi:hypothetical protein
MVKRESQKSTGAIILGQREYLCFLNVLSLGSLFVWLVAGADLFGEKSIVG